MNIYVFANITRYLRSDLLQGDRTPRQQRRLVWKLQRNSWGVWHWYCSHRSGRGGPYIRDERRLKTGEEDWLIVSPHCQLLSYFDQKLWVWEASKVGQKSKKKLSSVHTVKQLSSFSLCLLPVWVSEAGKKKKIQIKWSLMQIKVCQRQGNIYQTRRLQSMEISGRFWISAEWFKRRLGSQIVGAVMDCGKCCVCVSRDVRGLWRLEKFMALWKNVFTQTETEHYWGEESNYLSLSLGTVPQTVFPPSHPIPYPPS